MSEPTVCAIMLTRDRPELARKAVECFRAQTYKSKRLVVFDTGVDYFDRHCMFRYPSEFYYLHGLVQHPDHQAVNSIGSLRNLANGLAHLNWSTDVLIHWDDDDWSHPNRITEQVELLQTSGADVVGYNDMLFWRGPAGPGYMYPHKLDNGGLGEAWLYTVIPGLVPALGTSLCYWRKTWEKQKFANAPGPQGGSEYGTWLKGLKCVTTSTLWRGDVTGSFPNIEPRMIARIHAGNASRHAYNLEHHVIHQGTPITWKRVPEWDERVRGILA